MRSSLALFIAVAGCSSIEPGPDGGADMAVHCQATTPAVHLVESNCDPPAGTNCFVTMPSGFF